MNQPGLTLGDLLAAIWRQKLVVALLGLAGFAAAVAYLNIATYEYTATLQVIPAQNDSSRLSGGGSAAAAGLASLVGVNIGGGQAANSFGVYQEELKGFPVASELARDPRLMHAVFHRRWDAVGRRWRLEKSSIGRVADTVKSVLGLPVYQVTPPTTEDLVDFVRGSLKVEENERRSIVTLSFRNEDPILATSMLERLHATSNALLRAKMLAQSTDYIHYIEDRLRVASVAEYRIALTQLLSEQGKMQMIASSSLPFAASPLGAVNVSGRPTNPKPLLILAGGTIAGLILGGMAALLRSGILMRSNPPAWRVATMRVTGSLVLYNNARALFESAITSFLASPGDATLVVMDNSPEPLASDLFADPRVTYVVSGANLGFGRAHNAAFARVGERSDVHLILNPDVEFGPTVVPHLAALLVAHPAIGLVMPQIRYPDGSLQGLCKLLPTPADLFVRRFLPSARLRARHAARYELARLPQTGHSEVPSLSGCFLMVRSALFARVGGFDERFFMYMEDVDLVRRIGDHGATVYEPAASIVHQYAKGSYVNRTLLRYHAQSAIKYFNKWGWIDDPVRRSRNRRMLTRLDWPVSLDAPAPAWSGVRTGAPQ